MLLDQVEKQLNGNKFSVSKRGTGKSSFLYIKDANRAAEISIDSEKLWVEFWDSADEEQLEPPLKEKTYSQIPQAVADIIDWFECDR
jgi:uncharacterized protein (DUF1697 family)